MTTLDPAEHVRSSGYLPARPVGGGQELILDDIAAVLWASERVWVPFASTHTLSLKLSALGHHVIGPTTFEQEGSLDTVAECDALYFGTPTILGGRVLFPDSVPDPEAWSVEREREWVRGACSLALANGATLIVSGLGSGDVSVVDRLQDMGGGAVVVSKAFDGFWDHVLARPA